MMNSENIDELYMEQALNLAAIAYSLGEVPIGCLIVNESGIIAAQYNRKEMLNDCTAHAEILAIKTASKSLGRWRLYDCTIYSTLEPCFMCASALVQARIKKVVFGAYDKKFGGIESLFSIGTDQRLNWTFAIKSGVLAHKSKDILKQFFKEKRLKVA